MRPPGSTVDRTMLLRMNVDLKPLAGGNLGYGMPGPPGSGEGEGSRMIDGAAGLEDLPQSDLHTGISGSRKTRSKHF